MNDDTPTGMPAAPTVTPGHLHFPLRGLAGTGAEAAIQEALAGVRGIQSVQVSSGLAIAEVVFDEAVVSADEIRARLGRAGQREPKLDEKAAE